MDNAVRPADQAQAIAGGSGLPAFLGGSPKTDAPPPKGVSAKAGNPKKDLAKPVTPKKEPSKKKTSPGGKTPSAARRSGNKKKKR